MELLDLASCFGFVEGMWIGVRGSKILIDIKCDILAPYVCARFED